MKLEATVGFTVGSGHLNPRGQTVFEFVPYRFPEIVVTQVSLRSYMGEMSTGTISIQAPRTQGGVSALLMEAQKVYISLSVKLSDGNKVVSSLNRQFVVTTIKGKLDFNSEQLTFNVAPILIDSGKSNVTTTTITDEEIEILVDEVQNSTDIPRAKAVLNGFIKIFERRGIRVTVQEVVPLDLQEEFQPEQLKGDLFTVFKDFMYSSYRGFGNFPLVIDWKNNEIIVRRLIDVRAPLQLFYGPGFGVVDPKQQIYEQINMDNLVFTPGIGIINQIRNSQIDSQGKVHSAVVDVQFPGQGFNAVGKTPNFSTSNYHGLYSTLLMLMARNLQVRILGQDVEITQRVNIASKIKVDRFKSNSAVVDDPLLNNRSFVVVGVEHHIDNSGWFTDLRIFPINLAPVIQKTELSEFSTR